MNDLFFKSEEYVSDLVGCALGSVGRGWKRLIMKGCFSINSPVRAVEFPSSNPFVEVEDDSPPSTEVEADEDGELGIRARFRMT